jgi:hypothetical protein
MSHKKIEICENNGSKQIFTQSSSYTLNPLSTYRIEIFRVNPGGKICDAELKHINGTWNIQFIF